MEIWFDIKSGDWGKLNEYLIEEIKEHYENYDLRFVREHWVVKTIRDDTPSRIFKWCNKNKVWKLVDNGWEQTIRLTEEEYQIKLAAEIYERL